MKDLSTRFILNYLSNNLNDAFIDKNFFQQKELENLSQMICKTLELTDFIRDGVHYNLSVQ